MGKEYKGRSAKAQPTGISGVNLERTLAEENSVQRHNLICIFILEKQLLAKENRDSVLELSGAAQLDCKHSSSEGTEALPEEKPRSQMLP